MPRLDCNGRFVTGCLLAVLLWGSWLQAKELTVVSWGGAYEHSQQKAYFEAFSADTGIEIKVERYNGGLDELREQVARGKVSWDVVDMTMADNVRACNEGLLQPMNHAELASAPDGSPAIEDFLENTLTRCGVASVIYATVFAFDARAFPGSKPSSINALFDLERFPGKRGLQRKPIAILEWALRSYGVPGNQVYDLLSTPRGIKLAFARLDEIKSEIVWWEEGERPVEMLASQEVVMASGYNGRFFDAASVRGIPLRTVWDGGLYDYSTWGIPLGAPNSEAAWAFIRFATGTQPLADQAKYISYGPARKSSSERVWKHAKTGVDMRPHLPTFAPHLRQSIRRDHEWYALTQERLEQRFEQWLEQP